MRKQPQPPVAQPALSSSHLSSRTALIMALCLAAFVFVIYSPSLDFQFILDDHRFTADPRIQEPGHIWDYFANYVWAQFTGGPPSFYRPVFVLWMRINFILSALSPWGWHFLSVAKHISVAVLLGLLAWMLLRDRLAALGAATLFALHPAQTESVSWVTVPDPLMAAGVLTSLLFYFRYADAQSRGAVREEKRRRASSVRAPQSPGLWLVASAIAYFAALLAKETAIVFPAVVFTLAFAQPNGVTPNARPATVAMDFASRLRSAIRQVLPFLGVSAVYLLLRLNALHGNLGSATQHLSWQTVVLSWPATLWFYVKVLLWPVHSYSFADPLLAEGFSLHGVFLPLLELACAVTILAGALVWGWKRNQPEDSNDPNTDVRSALLAGTLLMFLPLLPALNLNALNPGDFLHGRYTYLPLAGLMLLVATGWHLAGKSRFALLGAVGVLTLAFAALTFAQEKQWADDSTVFTVAHRLAPHNAAVAQNLANTNVQAALRLDQEGRCNEAMPIFEQVTRDYPEDWYAWAGMGDCFVQLNNLPMAEQSLHRAAQLSHNDQVVQQWQELRAHMGLPPTVP